MAPGSDKQTMLGMPAKELPLAHPAQPVAPPIPPAMRTMLGVAIPGIAPTGAGPAPAPSPTNDGRLGTLLGIALPGIAPTKAGAFEAQTALLRPPSADPPRGLPAPPIVPAPAPLVMEPMPEAPRVPRRQGVPAIVVVGIVFSIVALVGAGAAFFVLRSGAPLTAKPKLDETGKESLAIQCASCPDGTVIALGASSAKVVGREGVLPLPAPLSIGDNVLEMSIDRPSAGRDETVKVHVPVAYRVKADLSSLASSTASTASIEVRVEAMAGTVVTVDGKPVALDPSGKGTQNVDVGNDVLGPSDEQKSIDRTIPFSILSKGSAAPETGQLLVRASVVALHMDAPGLELFTDRPTANVSGQTKPGATVTINGQAVTVNAQGHFAVRVDLSAEGEKNLSIVANAPPLAPRTVRSKVVRITSPDAAAKMLEGKAPLGFEAYGVDAASKIGQRVVVDGDVVEIRVADGHSTLLVEEKKTCSAAMGTCLVRIVHGEELRVVRGDGVRAFGRVVGTVRSGDKTVPNIEGTLVVPRPAGKK